MSNIYFVIEDRELKNLLRGLRKLREAPDMRVKLEKTEEEVRRRQRLLEEGLSHAARKWMKKVRRSGDSLTGVVELEDSRGNTYDVEIEVGLKADEGAYYVFPKPPEVPERVCSRIKDAIKSEVSRYLQENYGISEEELVEKKVYCG